MDIKAFTVNRRSGRRGALAGLLAGAAALIGPSAETEAHAAVRTLPETHLLCVQRRVDEPGLPFCATALFHHLSPGCLRQGVWRGR